MQRKLLTYGALTAFAFLSFGAAYFFRLTEWLAAFVGLPGVAALFFGLFQLIRDDAAHGRALDLKARDQNFALGAASHMADVTFDKHVAFCDEYATTILSLLPTLVGDGPTHKAEEISRELRTVRKKHMLWVPKELADRLDIFERAFFTISTDAGVLPHIHEPEKRREIVERMHATWSQITGFVSDEPIDEQLNYAFVIRGLQDILGVSELTKLRTQIVAKALNSTPRVQSAACRRLR